MCYIKSHVDVQFPKGTIPKKSYVYVHKDTDGFVFYVGSGKKRRGWCSKLRSNAWKERSEDGYILEILQEGMTRKQALQLEANLLNMFSQHNASLVNTILGIPDGNIKICKASEL